MNTSAGFNIVLTGMPGAGKSTIGPCLSKKLGMEYCDLDDTIKADQGRELRDIVKEYGFEYFLRVQEQIITSLNLTNHVLATGGSVIKSPLSMKHLKENGRVIYLQVDFETIEMRLAPGRKLARSGGQSLREVYDERLPLYREYADIIINCSEKSVETIVDEIISVL